MKTIAIEINGSPITYSVGEIVLDAEEFKHEMMTMEINNIVTEYSDIKPGAKIRTVIEDRGERRSFVGYVHHLEPGDSLKYTPTIVHSIGATFVMRTERNRTWSNMTATAVITQILGDYRLSYNIKPHPRVFPIITQSGMSDWKFICELAKRIGYVVVAKETTVHVLPRIQSWEDGRSSVTVLSLRRAGGLQISGLLQFNALAGDELPTDGLLPANPLTIGIDPDSFTIIGGKSDKKRPTKRIESTTSFSGITRKSATTQLEAEYESEAFRENTRFNQTATARAIGLPSLHPGTVVYLNGIGDTFGGYWLVSKATHIVRKLKYETIIHLKTDALGNDANPPTTDRAIDVSPGSVRIVPTTSLLLNNTQVALGETQTFNTSSKWTGAQSDIRTSISDAPAPPMAFSRMMEKRAARGI